MVLFLCCSAKSSGWGLDLENGLENFGAYAVDLRINEMSSGGGCGGGEGEDVVLKWRGCIGFVILDQRGRVKGAWMCVYCVGTI